MGGVRLPAVLCGLDEGARTLGWRFAPEGALRAAKSRGERGFVSTLGETGSRH